MASVTRGSGKSGSYRCMADFLTKRQRSALMSSIRNRGNKDTELLLARLFRIHGIRGWRRQFPIVQCTPPDLRPRKVRPDFVFLKLRIVVFIDGCFWHACPRHHRRPTSNVAFWVKKFDG